MRFAFLAVQHHTNRGDADGVAAIKAITSACRIACPSLAITLRHVHYAGA